MKGDETKETATYEMWKNKYPVGTTIGEAKADTTEKTAE